MLNKNKNKKIFVGLSGGVDSAVSAYLLKKANPNNFEKLFGRPTPKGFRGFDVVGVYIKTWQPDFITCTWPEERRDAMRVCAHLDIPFLMFDFSHDYEKLVAEKFIDDYKNGLTPNPDILCNREIKFGLFWDKAKEMGADAIATGHYAQIEDGFLKKGQDDSKDQAYFLWTLTKDDLAHTIFPLGNMTKKEVRSVAKSANLPVSEKKDSQGICFIGDIGMKDFLKNYIKEHDGIVKDKDGNTIGSHDGAEFFTLGERHGFEIKNKNPDRERLYVVSKDLEKNEIVVDTKFENFGQKEITLKDLNITGDISKGDKYKCQIRYHGEYLDCQIKEKKGENLTLEFNEKVLVSIGQSVVIYDGDIIVAGGVVL